MSVNNISTYAIFQSTVNDVATVENNLNIEQEQLSSGNKAQNFAGLTGQVQQFLSLDGTISRTNQYLSNNQIALTRINTTSSALSQVINAATSLQNLISQRLTGVGNNAGFSAQLQNNWQQIAGQLNTQVDGQYIFSGTKTNTAAVDSSKFPSLAQPGTPDTGYYHGSAQDITTRANDTVSLTTNVRGDSSGFESIVAGLVVAQQGDSEDSTTLLQQAEALVQQGIQSLTATQATVNANQVNLTNINSTLTNQKLYWQGVQQSIGNTDVVSVSTQVAINQGILQAAFQAFAKINSLQLSSFLK